MKAAVIAKSMDLEIWDVPVPVPGDYEVLCEMEYGSTCAGTDQRLMRGEHPNPVHYPGILGHESVGRVVEVGKKVKNYKVGDLVSRVGSPTGLMDDLGICWGGFAQYGIAKDHWQMKKDGIERCLWGKSRVNQIIPEEIDSRDAPMIITWRETLSYLLRLGVSAGKRVLILGAGANALSFVALSCNLGARVWVVGSLQKQAWFQKYPIEGYFDYHEEKLEERLADEGVQEMDFLVDGIGSSETVNRVLSCLKKGGLVGIYGWNDRRSAGINPFRASGSFQVYADGYDEEETHGAVIAMILRGELRAEDWYDKENPVSLTEISDAYERLKKHEAMKFLIRLKD